MFFLSWQPVTSTAPIIESEPVVDHEAELRTHIANIREAIYEIEGGCHTIRGGSGEYGCHQYLPATWRAYSMRVAGEILPQTRANEDFVTEGMIRIWLEEGVSERGIFLIWNQGNPGPSCYKGINKHGVRYDSCNYADRGIAALLAMSETAP